MMRIPWIKRVFHSKRFAVPCVAVGLGLLLLNIVGTAVPLRDPQIYQLPRNAYTGDSNTVLTAEEVWRQAKPLPNESVRDYAARVTRLVADGSAYLYESEHPELSKRNWRVPIWKNYLLWGSRRGLFLWRWARGRASWADRASVYRYVYSDYRHGIERGVGLCDQQTVDLIGLLGERGIRTHFVSFPRHSVVEAEVAPGLWWVLDPSHKTVLPYDVATLHRDPELVQSICAAQGRPPVTVDLLESCFSKPLDPSRIKASVEEAHGPFHYYFEFASYYLIWIIPAVMITVGLVGLRSERRRA